MTAAIVVWVVLAATPSIPQENSPQKLFETGRLDEVVARVRQQESPAPDQAYWLALALRKLERGGEAKDAFSRLAGAGEESSWGNIGRSGVALSDGDLDGALGAASRAVEQESGLPQAHYQLGLVRAARNEHNEAAAAFSKAAELNPSMAYAHYHAGMSFYQIKRIDRMAVYFESFLKVAPQAPEKPAVESIMRTVRGR